MDKKVILSKKNLFFLLPSLIALFSIWLSVFLSKLLNKKIHNIALESVAAFISCLLVIMGAYSIYFERQKKKALTKEEALESAKEEGNDDKDGNNIRTNGALEGQKEVEEGKGVNDQSVASDLREDKKKEDLKAKIGRVAEENSDGGNNNTKKDDEAAQKLQEIPTKPGRDQEENIGAKRTVKNRFAVLEGKDIYVDYVGTVICCTMQIITVALAAFPDLFKGHPYLATAHKVTDILGVACFPLAIGLMLLSIICKNKQQEIKEEEKNNKEHKKRILIGVVMLVGMALSLVGKSIGSFPTPLNVSLGNSKSFSIPLLTRVIGMGLFICALAYVSINRPKQHLDETKKLEISQNIPKTSTLAKS